MSHKHFISFYQKFIFLKHYIIYADGYCGAGKWLLVIHINDMEKDLLTLHFQNRLLFYNTFLIEFQMNEFILHAISTK